MSSSRVSDYYATQVSSVSLSPGEFYNAKSKDIAGVSSNISIYNGESTRLARKFYDLDPLDYKTKHDRVVEIICIVGVILATILAIVANLTPIGWIATAATALAYTAVAISSLALIERVSSDVTLMLNKEAMKGVLMEVRANIYAMCFILDKDNGVFNFQRQPDKLLDAEVVLVLNI